MSTTCTLSTHVLDTALGAPANGITVRLLRGTEALGRGVTDADGRVREFGTALTLGAGSHTLVFDVSEYFARTKRDTFYKEIAIAFEMASGGGHYHVPLLLSPYGYSTYRGS